MKTLTWAKLIAFWGVLSFGVLNMAQDTPTLTIDTTQILREIPSTVYGANFGLLNVIPVDLIEEALNSGVYFWRFPGGRVGDVQDLQNSQIDSFIRDARTYGMEPLIHVRLENGTPENGAEIVEYVNIEKEYNVRYWSVGNEPDLYDDFDVPRLLSEWREIVLAMKAIDPSIIIVGPDISQFTGEEGNEYLDVRHNYLRDFLQANGDLVDVVSVHRYPFPQNNQQTTIADLRANAPEWTEYAQNLRRYADDYGRSEMQMGFMETNSHWSATIGGEATADSRYHAVWWADVLGRLITENVDFVAYYSMQSNDQLGVFGLMARFEVRPTYYVYQLYKNFGNRLVFTQSSDNDVRIYGALNDNNQLTMIVINLSDDEKTRSLVLNGSEGGEAQVLRFDDTLNAEPVDTVLIENGGTLTVLPHSITLYTLGQ
jgi:alpha-L-arabinofuranosidase